MSDKLIQAEELQAVPVGVKTTNLWDSFLDLWKSMRALMTCDFPIPPIPPTYIINCSDPGVTAWFAIILNALSWPEVSSNFCWLEGCHPIGRRCRAWAGPHILHWWWHSHSFCLWWYIHQPELKADPCCNSICCIHTGTAESPIVPSLRCFLKFLVDLLGLDDHTPFRMVNE